jgi:hypothetical protein
MKGAFPSLLFLLIVGCTNNYLIAEVMIGSERCIVRLRNYL